MEQALPEPAESEYAAEGTLLHKHLEDPSLDRSALTIDQRESVERAEAICAEFEAKHLGSFDDTKLVKEVQVWFKSGDQKLFSGHPDRVRFSVKRHIAVVVDWKMGFSEITPAPENLQIRSYICQLHDWLDGVIDDYHAVVIPRMGPPHFVHYTRSDVKQARSEIITIWNAAHAKDAPRIASPDACQFCRGFSSGACPEAAKELPIVIASAEIERAPQSFREYWLALPVEHRGVFLDKLKLAEGHIELMRSAAKELLTEDPEAIPGWGLKDGKTRTKITDPIEAWGLIGDDLVDYQEWSKATSISLLVLVDVVATRDGISKTSAREILERRLDSVIQKSVDAPSLTMVK